MLSNQRLLDLAKLFPSTAPTFPVISPDNLELFCECPDVDMKEANLVVKRAHDGFNLWKQSSPMERSNTLKNWHKLIVQNKDDLAAILTSENGKPLVESQAEITTSASYVEFYAEEIRRIRGGIYSTPLGNGQIINKPEPVGVCALITPWNFPSSMLTRKAAPALAAGCSIIAKPDSQTPFSAIALANLAIEAGIPDSVFNLVTCRSENTSNIGELLATHPLIAKLSFTGSTRVGRLLMSQASHTLKRLSMELGGHAPFLVLDDADVEEAAAGIVKSRFRNAGQTCICANRIIIHRSVYEKVVSCLLEIISKMKIGSGFQKDVSLGPMINSEARSKLLERLNHAIMHEGARVIYGGETVQPEESKGAFMQPTLVENVSNESSLLKEELFGPVAVLIPVESDEEAISIANSSDYGLASYIYTKDSGRALRIADRLESGMVGINEVVISMADAPFGGVKQSGFGREGGHQGLMEYLHTKYINLKY